MIPRRSALAALPVVALCLAAAFPPARPATAAPAARPAPAAKAAHAYFAGGCFWSTESAFEGVKGVTSVVSGYTGGTEKNPSYEEVSAGLTGHYESVDVTYDPARISYDKLLDIYWHNIDPTQASGQFCDHGRQYRTAIFALDAAQAASARASLRQLQTSRALEAPIVTAILLAGPFWPAEGYHQDFARRNPEHYHAYRVGCGRDRRLEEIWGKDARRGSVPH